MRLFEPFIQKNGVVILDGALATELENRGAVLDNELWSAQILLESPGLIRQVHYDYLEAGADVIITSSYQATLEGFEKKGISRERGRELLELSVELACQARDEFWEKHTGTGRLRPLVAASVGPYGAYLADGSEYRGNYGRTIVELMDFHRERMTILAHAGPDLFAFETIPCLEEALALLILLKEFPGMPAWLSFSCRNETQISNGERIETALALVNNHEQIHAAGINCTKPAFVEALLRRCAVMSNTPLLAYPNSGEEWDAAHKCWLPASAAHDFTFLAERWYQAGARLIGGCCRTSPEDIKQLGCLLKKKDVLE